MPMLSPSAFRALFVILGLVALLLAGAPAVGL